MSIFLNLIVLGAGLHQVVSGRESSETGIWHWEQKGTGESVD